MPERPEVGTPAPEFELASNVGDQPIRLSDYKGKQAVVLYFYPADDTPGCTTESCGFRDLQSEFAAAGAAVLGVSPDDVASHGKFAAKFHLNFPLLADPDHKVAESYGAYGEKNMYGKKSMGIIRSTFVIGKDGNIAKVYARVKVNEHADSVLGVVRALPA